MPVKCHMWIQWELSSRNHAKIRPIFLCWVVKMDYVRSGFGNSRLITTAAYHHLSDMVSDGGLMKSFAGFLHIVVVLWLSECSWRLSPRFFGSSVGTLEVGMDHHQSSPLHEKAIKQRLSVNSIVWHARGIVIVVLWYMIKRLDGEIYLSFFREFSKPAAKKGEMGIDWP